MICYAVTERARGNVCAVVVTYRPDIDALKQLLAAITPQVRGVVMVANEGGKDAEALALLSIAHTALLSQDRNLGLAAAQNLGIDWARQRGYSHVLLLDQDSEPATDMVNQLMEALRSLSANRQVGAVGPRFHDLREHRDAPFVRLGFPLNRKLWCAEPAQVLGCDFLISSGSLISLSVLDSVGPMNAGLFIDNVDLEWCFRARAAGYELFGVCAAAMHHRLGDTRRALPFGWGAVVVHGPTRLYYMMRNRVLLYRLAHTPRLWIAQDVPRVLVKFFLFAALIRPRGRNLRFMLKGLLDGLRGRDGACPIA